MARRPMTPAQRYEEVAQRYMNDPSRTSVRGGLESLFAAEGPESVGTFVNIPSAKTSASGRLAAFQEMTDALAPFYGDDFDPSGILGPLIERSGQMGRGEYLTAPIENVTQQEGGFFGGKGMLSSPSGMSFGAGSEELSELEKASRMIKDAAAPSRFEGVGNLRQREILADEAARIAAMDDDADVFAADSVDEIGALLAQLDAKPKPKPTVDDQMPTPEETLQSTLVGGRGATVEKPGERAAYTKMREFLKEGSEKRDAATDAFLAGMSDVSKPKKGESREDMLERYKKEFYDATGIKADKVDKSRALMAFGLALMNNKVGGKGFSGALSALGEAGEVAMPYLDKAIDEAKSARISAGKYALQRIQADEDAAEAIRNANYALKKELYLKDLDYKRERELKILEASLEGGSKLTEALKNTEQQTLKIGANEIKLGRGQDIEYGGRTVWSDPIIDSQEVASAYKKTAEGLDTLQQMESLLTDMKEVGSGPGGTAGTKIMSRLIEVGNSMGMNLEYPSGDDVSIASQIEVLQRSVLARFKKFLTQETGNGISNVDVADIKAALGNFETFGDVDKAIMSVETIQELFKSSQRDLDPIIDSFLDRRQYRGGAQGQSDYEEVLKKFDNAFGGVNYIQPIESKDENGVTIIDYDIRSR